MKNVPDRIEKSGHCYTIRDRGPFAIGTDFKAPEPTSRILPKIILSDGAMDKLEACFRRVERGDAFVVADIKANRALFTEVTQELDLQNGVTETLVWYLSDWQFQPEERAVRQQLKKLRKAIDHFKFALPEENSAFGRFIYETYTGMGFLRKDLRPSESDLVYLEDLWREHHGFLACREKLEAMQQYVLAAEQCLGKKKPRNHRVLALVRSLAEFWLKRTSSMAHEWTRSSHLQADGPVCRFCPDRK